MRDEEEDCSGSLRRVDSGWRKHYLVVKVFQVPKLISPVANNTLRSNRELLAHASTDQLSTSEFVHLEKHATRVVRHKIRILCHYCVDRSLQARCAKGDQRTRAFRKCR